ncbi:hypothetical protein CALCODRAFT_520918 [Calocera cornea HHB12733]|uniref:Uncharacterized protein n=1 Tax=Calocera cornea HHB12733 TaxID=1353952 RepID=A0A165D5X4_9BASI|nr:hypothetical protein CALCODRAFT_520918 [Calocera cornea HHB12733]
MIFPAAPVSPDSMERTRPIPSRGLSLSYRDLEAIEECSCGNEDCDGHHDKKKEEVGYFPAPMSDALGFYSPTSSSSRGSTSSSSTLSTYTPLLPSTKLVRARAELLHRLPWSRSASLLCSLPDSGKEGEVWRAPKEFVPIHQVHQLPIPPDDSQGEYAVPPHRMWQPTRSRMHVVETVEQFHLDTEQLDTERFEAQRVEEEAGEDALEQAVRECLCIAREEAREDLRDDAEKDQSRRPRLWERRVLGFQLKVRPSFLRSAGRSQSTWF